MEHNDSKDGRVLPFFTAEEMEERKNMQREKGNNQRKMGNNQSYIMKGELSPEDAPGVCFVVRASDAASTLKAINFIMIDDGYITLDDKEMIYTLTHHNGEKLAIIVPSSSYDNYINICIDEIEEDGIGYVLANLYCERGEVGLLNCASSYDVGKSYIEAPGSEEEIFKEVIRMGMISGRGPEKTNLHPLDMD